MDNIHMTDAIPTESPVYEYIDLSEDSDNGLTNLDVLRERGLPIDLIYSELVAGNARTANLMFRTVVLEYIYSELNDAWDEADVSLVPSHSLTEHDDRLCFSDPGIQAIQFVSEDEQKENENRAYLTAFHAHKKHIDIDDDGNATTLRTIEYLIHTLVGNIITIIEEQTKDRVNALHVRICPDLSIAAIQWTGTQLHVLATVLLLAYATPSN